jgi:hypothetical protein
MLALLLVIAGSLRDAINVGVLAVALAWPIAVFAAGWKPDQLMATFPSSLSSHAAGCDTAVRCRAGERDDGRGDA